MNYHKHPNKKKQNQNQTIYNNQTKLYNLCNKSHPVLTMLAFSQNADNAATVSGLILGT